MLKAWDAYSGGNDGAVHPMFVAAFTAGYESGVDKTKAMRDAIMNILDDNGKDGHACCELVKQTAMEAVNAHYCPDWDYIPICPESPEWEACTCKVKQEIQDGK